MDVEDILKRISSKGDVGTAALGFVAGYILDLKLAIAGLLPGTAAALGATAAIGLKNTVQAIWDSSRTRAEQVRDIQGVHDELENAATEIEKLVVQDPWKPHNEAGKRRVLLDHELWTKKLITDEEFRTTIKDFLRNYRGFPTEARPLPAAKPSVSDKSGP